MNSNREEFVKYFDVLELPLDATLKEVNKTYYFLRELYSTESIVTIPAEGEISKEHREEILEQIEDAYKKILTLYDIEKKSRDKDLAKIISEITTFDGKILKMIRENLNIRLQDVSFTTRILVDHLINIEEENFSSLPAYVYTRGFIAAYAKYLSLSPEKVVQDYFEKYHIWKKEQERKPNRLTKPKWL